MGWYGGPRRGRMYRRGGGIWILPLIFIGFLMFSTRMFFFMLPALIVLGVIAFVAFMFLRPMLMGGMGNYSGPRWGGDQQDWWAEKRKHDFDDPYDEPEKTKNSPRYVMSDDGEPLEVIEEEKHKSDGHDDSEFV